MYDSGCRPYRRSGVVAHHSHWSARVCSEEGALYAAIYNPQSSNGSPKDNRSGRVLLPFPASEVEGLHPVALARALAQGIVDALDAAYPAQASAVGPAAPEGATGGACEGQMELTFA